MDVLPVGHEIGGYRIVRVAGRGAVGIVYEARHVTLGKRVAIKTLNHLFAGESEFRARFDREAQGAASVDHPNITAVFDAGEQGGTPYLVMTYVDGPDLERILEQRNGPLEAAEAILICHAVADALDAAAALGLAHRDVKPANILLEDWEVSAGAARRARPHVYLTDFGLTKHNAAATVTRTGQFVGTLLYMAPEQIEGHAVAASDQYSLACVLWECLLGMPPFLPTGGSNLSLLTAHLSDPVPPISARSRGKFPATLDGVFQQAMNKKSAKRYGSCVEFVEAAARALGLGQPFNEPASSDLASDGVAARPDPAEDLPGVSEGTQVISAGLLRDPDSFSPSSAPGAWGPGAGGRPSPAQPAPTQPAPTQPAPTQPTPAPTPVSEPTVPQGSTPAPPWTPGAGPAGMAQQSPPSKSGGGSKAWLWILLALLAIAAVAVGVILAGRSGDDTANAELSSAVADDATSDGPTQPSGQVLAPIAGTAGAVEPTSGSSGAGAPSTVGDPVQEGLVAFVADGAVWLADANGNNATSLIDVPSSGDGQPAWQPGHDALVVSVDGALTLVTVDTGERVDLTSGPGHSDPAWFSDGNSLVFSRPTDDGGRDLATVDLGGAVESLDVAAQVDTGTAPTVLNRPTVSVDGTIAFHANQSDGLEIWGRQPDGTVGRLAGSPGVNDFHPQFTPDGRLLYSTDQSGRDEVVLVDLATDEVVRVASPPDADAKDADASPCGDFVAFQAEGLPEAGGDEPRVAVRPLVETAVGPPATLIPLAAGMTEMRDPAWSGQACG